jgi:hypothetical protein
MDLKVTVNIPSSDELAGILGCTPQALPTALKPFAEAAIQEYVAMFLGQKVLKRGSDILEYRLFLMIQHAFAGQLPDEQTIATLFQATPGESRSLIRGVVTRYRTSLKSSIEASLKAIIAAADRKKDTDNYTVVVKSRNLIDALNAILSQKDGTLTSIVRKKDSVSTYEIKPSSYQELASRFGVKPKK